MNNIIHGNSDLALMQAARQQIAQKANLESIAGKVENFAQIEEAAKDFEAVFLAEMIKPMFEGLKPDPLFGGGRGEEVFHGMLIQEYGKIIAERGGIGIAEFVKTELIRIQEESQK